jgi:hypothetical protein
VKLGRRGKLRAGNALQKTTNKITEKAIKKFEVD